MLASAARLPASVAIYFAIAPSVFRLPSAPPSMRSAVSSMKARAASSRATCGTISLCVYPCFSESGDPAWRRLVEYGIARSSADQPPPKPKAATIRRVYPKTGRAPEPGPQPPKASGPHHRAGVPEAGLRRVQSLAFHPAHEPIGIDIYVVKR